MTRAPCRRRNEGSVPRAEKFGDVITADDKVLNEEGESRMHHRTSTPHRSETNGIAESAVRRMKEGTSAVLLQSGLDEKWWADSRECYCYLRNVQDLLADGETPYQ